MEFLGPMNKFDSELSEIVGLDELKAQVRKWVKGMLLDKNRRGIDRRKLPHMAFLGSSGTGKTKVARILGRLLHSIGFLSSGKVTEVQPTDLVVGTGSLEKIFQEAMYGILFIDDAYRLDPGMKMLDSIMSAMGNPIISSMGRIHILVIMAGPTKPMKRLFASNERLCRRVSHFFQFDDYSCRELAEMLVMKMRNQQTGLFGFRLDSCCSVDAVASVIETGSSGKMRSRLNGGLVDHMLDNARENLDSRLDFEAKGDELCTIGLGDLKAGLDLLARELNLDEEDEIFGIY